MHGGLVMSDVADRAKRFESQQRQHAIDAIRHRKHETPELDEHGERICKSCGDIIKKMRLMALPHAVRCVPCQEECEGCS